MTELKKKKWQKDLCLFPRQTIQYHSNPSLCPTSNAEEAEFEWFYEDLQDVLELTPKKDVLFITKGWNAKVGSQETPGATDKFGLGIWNEAGQRLIEFCQENALLIANTLFHQHKRRLYTWSQQMVNTKIRLTIFFAPKDGEAVYRQQKQDWKLTVAQIMNSLLPNSDLNWTKKGKTTRPFRYDLNQIPYDYTLGVTNRFKRLDLIDKVPEELWTEVHDMYRREGSRPSPRKRNAKRQNGCLRRPYR